ncbi:uncharacterized protein MONOS_191 [Monocercomonoides exilis]|uniref:uncharacterized protein n=1 Tax=Monocercomonoides exilis TaxID=2049356 RepID=UPI00355A013F|nr:hypothetical protein MONOS_191 [Monocercomonoides exilis]|eukprot:MONOS_191.1-p1 / transcript=MONOS_191.1 / gene=MONOS_191 / organism=Monocercomonoides_exilis_PA203 / gene_product=unspecified product / transcript_product=unspecified product / location=Mono_scaffold00003:200351-203121(+) / protein_length=802 / sequence_SO=supercontig / SO=protein_coding / is_pseudo=false
MDDKSITKEEEITQLLKKEIEEFRSGDISLQSKALASIRSKFSTQTSVPCEYLMKYNFLSDLVGILMNFSIPTNQLNALWLLTNMSYYSEKVSASLVQLNIMAQILQIVTIQQDLQIKTQAWWLASNILHDQILNVSTLFTNDLLKAAISDLSAAFGIVNKICSGTSASSTSTHPTMCVKVCSSFSHSDGASSSVVRKATNEEAFLEILLFLFKRLCSNQTVIQQISAFTPQLCDIVVCEKIDKVPRRDAVYILSTIINSKPQEAETYMAKQCLLPTFQLSADDGFCQDSLEILQIVSAITMLPETYNKDLLFTRSFLTFLEVSLLSGDNKVKDEASFVFSNLAAESQEQAEVMCRHSVLRVAIVIFTSSATTTKTSSSLLLGFSNLTLMSSITRRLLIEECCHIAITMRLSSWMFAIAHAEKEGPAEGWEWMVEKSLSVLKRLLDEAQLISCEWTEKNREDGKEVQMEDEENDMEEEEAVECPSYSQFLADCVPVGAGSKSMSDACLSRTMLMSASSTTANASCKSSSTTSLQRPLWNRDKTKKTAELVDNIVIIELTLAEQVVWVAECSANCTGKMQKMAQFIFDRYLCVSPWVRCDSSSENETCELHSVRDGHNASSQELNDKAKENEVAMDEDKEKVDEGDCIAEASVLSFVQFSSKRITDFYNMLVLVDAINRISNDEERERLILKQKKRLNLANEDCLIKGKRKEKEYFGTIQSKDYLINEEDPDEANEDKREGMQLEKDDGTYEEVGSEVLVHDDESEDDSNDQCDSENSNFDADDNFHADSSCFNQGMLFTNV